MTIDTLAIIGVGLLGGSLARAARQRGVARHIVGVEPDEVSARLALSAGLVDELVPEAKADVVVCCAPVDCVAELLLAAAEHGKAGTLLTDVGSTKATIVQAVEKSLPPHVLFAGSHPLAGSEKQGPEHADGRLFESRLVIVTPTETTPRAAVEQVSAFWQALGARVRLMSPEEHDRGVALTSHLPHLIASALAGVLPPSLAELTASGFRDTTRLAASDPRLWTAIALQNRDFLLEALATFAGRIEQFQRALEEKDEGRLFELLAVGCKMRKDVTGAAACGLAALR